MPHFNSTLLAPLAFGTVAVAADPTPTKADNTANTLADSRAASNH